MNDANGYEGYQDNAGYGQMQMQDQNYGYGDSSADPYYMQQMAMQQGMGGYGYQGGMDMNGYPMQPQMMYDANGYPMQPQMMYDANGFPMETQGGEGYDPQQYDPQGDYGAAPNAAYYDAQQTETPVSQTRGDDAEDRGGDRGGNRGDSDGMRRKKSFTGPPEGTKPLAKSRSTKAASSSQRKGSTSDGLARNGSVFQIKSERDTQRSVSTRGSFGTSSRGIDADELGEYYGDMAKRYGDQRFDGVKAVKSYRGEIKDGIDVGKPRRVTGARSLQGKGSTGYGGLNFKRQCAMRNGESWGDIEVRRKANSNNATPKSRGIGFNVGDDDDDDADAAAAAAARRAAEEAERQRREMEEFMRQQREAELLAMQQQQMMMLAMMDQPAVPHVFNQDDVHSYSNLSDAFAEDQIEDEEDFYDNSAK